VPGGWLRPRSGQSSTKEICIGNAAAILDSASAVAFRTSPEHSGCSMWLVNSRRTLTMRSAWLQCALKVRLSVCTLTSAGSPTKCLPGGGSIESSSTAVPLQQGVGSDVGRLRTNSGPIRKSPVDGRRRSPGGIGKPWPAVGGVEACES
jgi:hypothetical protein